MRPAGWLLAAAALACSCGIVKDAVKRSGEIEEVEAAVVRLLGHRNVDAFLENSPEFLKVEIKNSPLRDLPPAERRSKALQIAGLAYGTYASRSGLKTIEVVFVMDKTETSTFTSTRNYDASARYEFAVSELETSSSPNRR